MAALHVQQIFHDTENMEALIEMKRSSLPNAHLLYTCEHRCKSHGMLDKERWTLESGIFKLAENIGN